MKRYFIALFVVLAASLCWGDKAADIADIKNQIATLEGETPKMLDALNALKTEKENQIDFVGQAYDKQKAQYDQDVQNFNVKADNLKRQYDLLEPALQNYNQRVAQHNANVCTEKCVNGSCDGSCAWYTAEKAQLDANEAQLQQAYAPLDQQKAQLQQDKSYLDQTADKLETIRTNLNDEVSSWKDKVAQLKADWEAHQQKMAELEAKLAALYGDVNSCLQDIPVECERPQIGPDGKPILNQNCENMKAQCSKMFDGNR